MSRIAYPPLIGSKRSEIATIGEIGIAKYLEGRMFVDKKYIRVFCLGLCPVKPTQADLAEEWLKPIERVMTRKPKTAYESVR